MCFEQTSTFRKTIQQLHNMRHIIQQYHPLTDKMDIVDYGKLEYSQTQEQILQKLLLGETCVLLGFPGSGKTKMTAHIADVLVSVHKKNIGVTGSTGSAPQQIEQKMLHHDKIKAQTVHSFFGFQSMELRIMEKSIKAFEDMIKYQHSRKKKSRQNIVDCDVLIIDEISMLTSEFLYALDITAKLYRKNKESFGGLTLLMVGDFRQLPPVNKDIHKYAFLNPLWDRWITNTFSLNFILRQQTDPLYTNLIVKMSHNKLTKADKQIFLSRIVKDGKHKIMDPTYMPEALRVFHTNTLVKIYNDAVTKNQPRQKCYTVDLLWDLPSCFTDEIIKKTKRNMLGKIFYSTEVFIGARVILTSNLDVSNGIVNGSTGTLECVENYIEKDTRIYGGTRLGKVFYIKLDSGKLIGVGSQAHEFLYDDAQKKELKCTVYYIPVLLSHAMTVHRLQGSTINRPIFYWPFDMKEINNSHFYVVCTRVTSLQLLHLVCVPRNIDVVIDPLVIAYYDRLFRKM